MSAPLPDSGIVGREAPPPYDAASSSGAPADLPAEKAPLPDKVGGQFEPASGSGHPPPFALTPGTLILARDAVVIRPAVPGARPLYELSRPLDGHATSVLLMYVPEYRVLHWDGTMWGAEEQDKLYRIYEHRDLANMNARVAQVSAQHHKQFYGVRLSWGSSLGLTGVKESFEATWGDDLNRKTVYQARENKGCLEWRDSTNKLVAIDSRTNFRGSREESLDILVSLDKKHLDLIVALWVARIWHDTQDEGHKEDKKGATRRKHEQKQLDKEEGRPHGPLHDVKEALGIGYGVKGPSNGLYPGGMPGTNQNGRINWGGSKG